MSVETGQALSQAELEGVRRLGYDATPELIEACLPALTRGRSIALLAADGSGIELLYALAVERGRGAEEGIQALLLTPTRARAAGCAAAVNAFDPDGGPRGLVWPPAGSPGAALPPGAVALAGRATEILPEVRSGRLRLGSLRLLVIDGVEAIEQAGDWPSVEALMATLDTGTSKIVSCLAPGSHLNDLMTHQLSRAFRWPSELFDETSPEPVGGSAPLLYGAAPGVEERLDLLAAALATAGSGATVVCADEPSAAEVRRGLAARGVGGDPGSDTPSIRVTCDPAAASAGQPVAVFGLPVDFGSLTTRLGPASRRVAVVSMRHLGQLLLHARRAGWPAKAIPAVASRPDLDPVERFRALVREEVQRVEPAAELLLLEPLMEEYGTVPVAAALASLLRRRAAGPATVKQWPDMEADSGLAVGPTASADGERERGTRSAWTRIYVAVGRRDGAKANDLVGAITGETGLVGGQIGKIEIRNSFTLVDIDSQVVDDVIRGLDGASIKGRTVSVRLDREA